MKGLLFLPRDGNCVVVLGTLWFGTQQNTGCKKERESHGNPLSSSVGLVERKASYRAAYVLRRVSGVAKSGYVISSCLV